MDLTEDQPKQQDAKAARKYDEEGWDWTCKSLTWNADVLSLPGESTKLGPSGL